MDVPAHVPKRLMVNAYLLFFVVHTNQVGVGVLGFHRLIAKYVRQDAWIAVLLAGLFVHLVFWVMVRTLRLFEPTDLYGLHRAVWGKWLGTGLNVFYLLLMAAPTLVIIQTYTEVLQTWISPNLSSWFISLALLGLVVYGLLGGLRVIVGFCVLSLFLTVWMALLAYYPLQYAVWTHLQPVLEANASDMMTAVQKMSLTLSGFEIIYFVYPYVREPRQVMRYGQLGVLFTNLLYLIAMLTATVYFSHDQLMRNIWAQLSILKIIQVPFLERFEYVVIPLWVFVVLPNMLLYTWASTRGLKRVFRLQQKKGVYVVALLLFGLGFLFKTRQQVNHLNDLFNDLYLYAAFLYPLVLYPAALIRKKWQQRREVRSS
ncbi:GerAB/ArcD/ProY family transporter [Tumebacillus sp. ITR2]|uniref:GerAB/ArcD/ProY family transporter n=1 Tax=Tumebacillus amylolyticus TaxID=2801339 RepID=A0ABS1JFQ5_9BACL|nr:GerAB/ArcD/ProY family transporter [Tumebacillus amylolyticus]MBL0389124.1 GerAB/ArcD/ProY family transporter [Tumebacillus amylolyticus]